MHSVRAHVCRFHEQVAGQFPLDAEVPLLDIRMVVVPQESHIAVANGSERAKPIANRLPQSVRKWIAEQPAAIWIIERRNAIWRVYWTGDRVEALNRWVIAAVVRSGAWVENSECGSYHRLVVDGVGETQTRPPIVMMREAHALANSVHARKARRAFVWRLWPRSQA